VNEIDFIVVCRRCPTDRKRALAPRVSFLLISLCAVALTVPACAQLKPGNGAGAIPIIRDKFTADPAPLVVGGTLYLYPS
jgi:hypothetical protein